MNGTDHAILLPLIHRTRNRLWGRRLLQTLWYGFCLGVCLLFLLALVHILVTAIPVYVWLPCLTLPGLLMAFWAALRQRPTCADAAMELDRNGKHDELLVSAWEMLAMAPGKRPAGAGPVLLRADEVCAQIDLPGVLTPSSPWQGRFSSLPWILMIIAFFLLQLSTHGFHRQLPDQASTGYAQVDGRGMRHIAGGYPTPDSSNRDASISEKRQGDPASTYETAANNTSVQVPMEKVGGSADAAAKNKPGSELQSGSSAQGAVQDGEDSGIALPPKPAISSTTDQAVTRFEDISRIASADASRAISTTGNAGFREHHNSPGDAHQAEPMNIAARPRGVNHNNLFSLSQRLQIQTYFDSLEETP